MHSPSLESTTVTEEGWDAGDFADLEGVLGGADRKLIFIPSGRGPGMFVLMWKNKPLHKFWNHLE